ncbi:MAG: hypothetical protein NT013_29880 [Planctomycetia bacterium]|nr:hypothetical protein [Planctomycetia bacterium]
MRTMAEFLKQVRTRLGMPGGSSRRRTGWHGIANIRLEALEPRLVLHANVVLDAEHLAVFGARDATTGVVSDGLVSDAALTYKSIGSGNWSNASIWGHNDGNGNFVSDGTLPGNNANVLISSGTVVTVDGNESIDSNNNRVALRTIRDDGTLRFDPNADTRLLVDTIIVEPIGVFEMGTKATPIATNHKARLVFADREMGLTPAQQVAFDAAQLAWDPLQFSHGLVSHGEVSIYGSTVTSFVNVGAGLNEKATTIDLSSSPPTGWQVGDRLVISGSTAANSKGVNQDEQLAIAAINGNTVVLSAPLKYKHAAGMAYVADVTRNTTLASENPSIVAHRGHVMFMHNDDVHVAGAGFYGLGRTDKRTLIDDPVLVDDLDHPGMKTTDVITPYVNAEHPELGHRVLVPVVDAAGNQVKNADGTVQTQVARTGLNPRGRYAVHFHRTGFGEDVATINDSAVVDSPGWGIVNHSSNLNVTDNVVFNATGAAYITEAGDEIGSFDHNIAIHSLGSGDGLESRKQVQDFGHQGDGFWLQGGNVSLTNNVVAGQRHSGYLFFPVGLKQKGLGTATISGANLTQYSWADPTKAYAVGDVPLKQFKGNVAFGAEDGFESWFTLLNVTHHDQSVIENFSVRNTKGSSAIFTPYTNQMTFRNVTAIGNPASPGGTGFNGNTVTRNITYDHVSVIGYGVGIDAPLNGTNRIVGGTFNNLKNIVIMTANSRDRVVNIDDAGPNDLIQFVDNLTSIVNEVVTPRTQSDVFLETNFNPKERDLTLLFNRDVILMGTVTHNGQQLYYIEQDANFIPFNTASPGGVASWVPIALRDKTNQQIFAQYGLAIGGVVAPVTATQSDARINALIGPTSAYLPSLELGSAKYSNDLENYKLSYSFKYHARVVVRELIATPLAEGWNLLTRTILGATRTLLVFGDITPPTFQTNLNIAKTLNQADLANGTNFVIDGKILDNSFGSKRFNIIIKLNDANHVSALKTRADGSQYVTISFKIKDFADNTSIVNLDFTVSTTATLVKDMGRKNQPLFDVSATLQALLANQ